MSELMRNVILAHYRGVWAGQPTLRNWTAGPTHELAPEFTVAEFPPSEHRELWTYATVCMTDYERHDHGIELHLFTYRQSIFLVELLTIVAHYHNTASALNLGHTVNFGRPWVATSACDYGLISLPYLDGPPLEDLLVAGPPKTVKCLWLIPITQVEREFKVNNGLEALEEKFEEASFDYADINRASVV